MENPFRRLRELTRTSQKDFASKYDFAKTTMTYIESGQYPDLSEYQIDSLAQECEATHVNAKQVLADEYNGQDLNTAYHTWQTGERIQIASQVRLVSPTEGTILPPISPFDYFVKDVAGSVQAFCKMLKVPAASVTRYAKGQTKTMPLAIRQALGEVQYPYMQELTAQMDRWNAR